MRIPILAAVALAAGCASGGPVVETPGRSLSATLDATGAFEGRSAVAVNTVTGNTAASISLAGDRSGAVRPWHVHTGTCGSGGGIVGDPTAYPPLRAGTNGSATAEARVDVGLRPGQQYHVNIHESPSSLGNIVACGNLR